MKKLTKQQGRMPRKMEDWLNTGVCLHTLKIIYPKCGQRLSLSDIIQKQKEAKLVVVVIMSPKQKKALVWYLIMPPKNTPHSIKSSKLSMAQLGYFWPK